MNANASTQEEVELRGRVENVRYSSSKFTVGTLSVPGSGTVTFAGKGMVRAGDPVILTGTWEVHERWGKQLRVSKMAFDAEPSGDGLAHYLANNPNFPGIGKVKAEMLAKAFGKDFDQVIEKDPERVAQVVRLPLVVVQKMRKAWLESRETLHARLFLASLGLTDGVIEDLVAAYGNGVVNVVRSDPFAVCREIRGFGFKRADEIAQKAGVPADHPGRIEAACRFIVDRDVGEGHTWSPFVEVVQGVMQLLGVRDRALVEATLNRLQNERKELEGAQVDEMTYGVGRVDLFEKERDVGTRLQAAKAAAHFTAEEAEQIARGAEDCNVAQRRALWRALTFDLSVVTGVAGTGKTYVMGKIARAFEEKGKRVSLCAPTGKAARRMEEVSGRSAQTIHRLLGYDGKGWMVEEVDCDLLLVDEMSMIDVGLMARLLSSLREGSSVVFFGDHHQLPPVGAGSVLRDVVARKLAPVTILDEVIRQAGVLKYNSTALLSGEVKPSAWAKGSDGKIEVPWMLDDRHEHAGVVTARVVKLVTEELPAKVGYALPEIQVLAPVYKGGCGVDALNLALQRAIQKRDRGVEVPLPPEDRGESWRAPLLVGDRVLQLRNNYQLGKAGIMNGSLGIVRGMTMDGTLEVEFEGETVAVAKKDQRDLDLGWAVSTHKFQGSQVPCAIVVAHSSQTFGSNRSILYTGVTRAQRTCIIVGDRRGVAGAAARQDSMRRRTWLSVWNMRSF